MKKQENAMILPNFALICFAGNKKMVISSCLKTVLILTLII
ncbi:hypothetical protein PRO82_000861 [Candidatus Protochlamydia amoebophila]|nr:hypothetical protein [Candidatus Protochlamydia amoebophila]